MKVLFDTNVIMDLLLARTPHDIYAKDLFGHVEKEQIQGFLCATTVTTIHYLATKKMGTQPAVESIRSLLTFFDVATVNRAVIEAALATNFKDFEDAVLHESARLRQVDAIVTRNTKDFTQASLRIFTPIELVTILQIQNNAKTD